MCRKMKKRTHSDSILDQCPWSCVSCWLYLLHYFTARDKLKRRVAARQKRAARARERENDFQSMLCQLSFIEFEHFAARDWRLTWIRIVSWRNLLCLVGLYDENWQMLSYIRLTACAHMWDNVHCIFIQLNNAIDHSKRKLSTISFVYIRRRYLSEVR
jgi:hypothetical protein